MTTAHFGSRREILSRKEAAAYLGVSAQTLAVWEHKKRYGLPTLKVGRLAKYDRADLDAWLDSRKSGGQHA